jgi:predicted DsbA family dithiol-disulfide isomerase
MKMPPVQPRSRLAHEAAQWARTQGRFEDFNAAIFRAFFERGEDIGQMDVLLQLASELSLDRQVLRAALENEEFRETVLADERDAQDIGVKAVPSFVADRRATVSGVQSLATLRELIGRVRS